MITGLGIDAVEIDRFTDWADYPLKKLLRVFSKDEIEYCLSIPIKSAERFAARFAAKEAFFKALHMTTPTAHIPLFTICKKVAVKRLDDGTRILSIDWNYLQKVSKTTLPNAITSHVSLTHTKTTATAIIILEK